VGRGVEMPLLVDVGLVVVEDAMLETGGVAGVPGTLTQ
jgi:hypothetical protein